MNMMQVDLAPAPIDEEQKALDEAMSKLSIEDQNRVEYTLQNGCDVAEITFLDKVFEELDLAIKKLETDNDPNYYYYKLARDKDPSYVDDPKFKIGYLRAEHYNALDAAARMFRNLKLKYELFGIEKLTRDIVLDDLGKRAREFLEYGELQLLPKRDRAGRLVIIDLQNRGYISFNDEKVKDMAKSWFYFFNTLSELDNEEGRVKGVVAIVWKVHRPPLPTIAVGKAIPPTWQNCPVKISAFHVCYGSRSVFNLPDIDTFTLVSVAWMQTFRDMALRRSHYGEVIENGYKLLMIYGIPSDCLPINNSAEHVYKPNNSESIFSNIHTQWWMSRREQIDRAKSDIINSLKSSNNTRDSSALMLDSGRNSIGTLCVENSSVSGSFVRMSWMESRNSMTTNSNDLSGSDLFRISGVSLASVYDDINMIMDPECEDLDVDIAAQISQQMLTPVKKFRIKHVLERDIKSGDIKLGRGKPLQRHPGNMWFREYVAKHYDTYDGMEKKQQTNFSLKIVKEIESEGRKFWIAHREQIGYWIELSENAARDKVSYTFRTMRKNEAEKKKGVLTE